MDKTSKELRLVLVVSLVVLMLKLFVSYFAYGTNDISNWRYFAGMIQEHGTFQVYSVAPNYNLPPLTSWLLEAVCFVINNTGLHFPYVFRLLPIFSDFLCVFVVWGLLVHYKAKHKMLIAIACAANPINFCVSAFHGNLDTVFIFLVLLAIYSVEKERFALAGLACGLSVGIKIVPFLLIPVFLLKIIILPEQE